MNLTLRNLEDEKDINLTDVKNVYVIGQNYTQCDELKNSILVIHKIGHCEKFRLYKNTIIVSIDN